MSTNTNDTTANKPDVTKPDNKPAGDAAAPDKPGEGGGDAGATSEPVKAYTQADVEAAEARGRREAEAAVKKKADDAKLSDTERERQRADTAETALRTREARDQFETAAKGAGANNAAKVFRLYKDDMEFDDKGKPTNLAILVAQAKREFPDEFVKKPGGSADGAAGGGGAPKRTMNDIIRGKR